MLSMLRLQSDPKQILNPLIRLLGSLAVSPVPDTEEMLANIHLKKTCFSFVIDV